METVQRLSATAAAGTASAPGDLNRVLAPVLAGDTDLRATTVATATSTSGVIAAGAVAVSGIDLSAGRVDGATLLKIRDITLLLVPHLLRHLH
jgi:hypothetical protein